MITTVKIRQYQTPQFDAQFAAAHQAGQIAWYPWVGKQYPQAGYKVLVVLESHYINREKTNVEDVARPDYTRRLVAEQIHPKYRWNNPTFTNLTACLSGRNLQPEEMHRLWEKAALYNFIQRPMENPNARPAAQDFEIGWKTFLTVTDILRPDVCIFAGFAAISHLDNLPAGLQITGTTPWEKDAINNTYPRPCFTISTPHGTLKGAAVKHPGRFFTVDKWHAVLQRQIPQAIKTLS